MVTGVYYLHLIARESCHCDQQDKICDFWEITKQKLKDAENSCKNKDREMEMLEEQKHMEIQV